MGILQLGPFMLDVDLVALLFSAVLGYAAIAYGIKRRNADPKIRDKFGNAIVLGLLFWKFSIAIFDFQTVVHHPWSLMYYDGGWRGALLGAALAILYVWRVTRKEGISPRLSLELAVMGWVTGRGAYFLFLMTQFPDRIWVYALFLALQGAVAWTLLLKRQPAGNKAAILVVLLLAGWGIYDQVNKMTVSASKPSGSITETGTKKGMAAPDFELLDLNGEPVRLSGLKGKKVVLNFWATWCPPCQAEMPHMEKISQQHAEDAVVLGVNMTHTERNSAAVSQFAESYRLSFPIVLDEKGATADTYRVRAYPTTYVIDSDGIIREIYEGAITGDLLSKTLNRIP